MRRRDFMGILGGGLALGTLAGLLPTRLARAETARPHRFVFVVNQGGWDPLCVLAPLFGNAQLEMPILSTPTTIGGIPLVDSELRPAVRAFFERHAGRCLVLHGVDTKSVAHEVCQVTMMTGQATGERPDAATLIASDSGVTLPHLVLGGPVYPGLLGSRVARSGQSGQLQALVDGSILESFDSPPPPLARPSRDLMDDFVRRRTAAWSEATGRVDLLNSLERAQSLKALRGEVSLATDGSFAGQLEVALGALRLGLARCVTVSPPVSWDTHTDSDNQQSPLWDGLFSALDRFVGALLTTPSQGGTLADDTTLVVLSEMSRTPRLNADNGRDHWPFTSVLLVSPRVTGGRAVGGYDLGYRGQGIDPLSGETDPSRASPTPLQLGATLLALAGLDASAYGPKVEPLLGVLT